MTAKKKMPSTLGELKKSGYQLKSVKDEVRANLITQIKNKEDLFEGIYGYENTVVPQVQHALLARHNILFLGLRGQAKTRMAREMLNLLDEYVPVVVGSEVSDNPLAPISHHAKNLIKEQGDKTPIEWLHRSERYAEKLATPDVSVADLIGDADPIKAANLKLSYGDERIIHFGLMPRSNRGIFVINELPDLQPRIQVSLFNILEEGDIQIRGFKLRLPLDILFVFTANPEDYTSRGSIVTPLKDRIESQIITHYPKDLPTALKITRAEARVVDDVHARIEIPSLVDEIIEQISFEARDSEFIDQKSGVSARLGIAARELLFATAERRMELNGEKKTVARISDLYQIVPSITGKIELVYEGEQEGAAIVARNLIGKAVRSIFACYFPDPEELKKRKNQADSPYKNVSAWFSKGNELDIIGDQSNKEYKEGLAKVESLKATTSELLEGADDLIFQEFLLHGMSEYSLIKKATLETQQVFSDMVSGLFSFDEDDMNDLDEDDFYNN